MTDNTFTILGKPSVHFKATHFLSRNGVPTIHGLTLNNRFRTTVPLSRVVGTREFMTKARTLCREQAIISECTDIAKHGSIVAPKYIHRLLVEHCPQAYNIKDWSRLSTQAHERTYYTAESNSLRVMVSDDKLIVYAGPEGRKACMQFIGQKENVG